MLDKTLEKWEEKTLGDICNIGAGNSAPQDKSLFKDGHYPFIRTADVGKIHFGKIYSSTDLLNDEGIKGLKLFKRGTILIPKSGASTFLNHRVKMEIDGYVVSHLATVKGNEKFINDDFLLYYLSTINVKDLIQDQNYPSVNLPIISNIKIKLPSLPKQQRIVGILDEAFENIEKAKQNTLQNLNNAKELFESYLESIYLNNIDNLKVKSLSEIAIIKGGKRLPKGQKLTKIITQHPYLRVTDFSNDGTINTSDLHYISDNIYEQIKNYTITSKDLYITIVGATIGKSGIIPRELDGANLTENACKLIFNENIYNKYVYYFTKTKSFREQSFGNTKITAVPKLALTRLATIKLPIPQIAEQQKIVQQLDELQEQVKKLEQIYTQKLQDLDELKQSLLQKAFNGEL